MKPRPHSPQTGMTRCGESRREFLWQAGGGFFGTALTWLLAQQGYFGTAAQSSAQAAPLRSPTAPRPPHFAAKAKRCIMLFMYGGPSQVDLFDPKPELTKHSGQPIPNLESDSLLKVRNPGTLLASQYEFKHHGESGTQISALFPNLARHADEMCIIRSTYADSFAHGSGMLQMNTGFLRQGFPCLGSWVSYGLGTFNENLPAFVVMLDQRGGPITGPPNWSSGFMPAAFQGTVLRTAGDPILNLSPQPGVTLAQQRQQLDLLNTLNSAHAERTPDQSELPARIAAYELAYRMQTHAPEAVDLSQETAATRALYGLDDSKTQPFGERCLLARRLIERGVRFVQIFSGGGHLDQNWDAHSDVNSNHELHCGETDLPIAGLLTDLKARGLLEDTLIVWAGEFGRTPTGQNGKGRDHSPRGFSTWLAGGGAKGGSVVGATDDFGYAAVENRVHVHDLHATILHLMGMDHEVLTYFHGGRDMRLTDVAGRVVPEVLA